MVSDCLLRDMLARLSVGASLKRLGRHMKGVRGFVEIVNDDDAGLEGHDRTLSYFAFCSPLGEFALTRGCWCRPVITVGPREELLVGGPR